VPRRRRERLHLNADINVVNLIDVMLLLLVVFMITAPMMTGGVDISLPKAEARPLESKSGLTVTITQSGGILVDETPMSFGEFRGAFRAMAAQRGRQGLYLRADRSVDYGTVVRVLAIMRAAGVGDVGLVTEPEDIPR
jgi:biopolymer transport protein ExbD/biopolymer transport protein TolR